MRLIAPFIPRSARCLVITCLILLPTATHATVIDMAGIPGNLFVLDDAGRIWLWDEEGPDHGCFWHHLDTMPGATMFDWGEDGVDSIVGAIVVGSEFRAVRYNTSSRTFTTLETYSHPAIDPVDVGFGGTNGTFWIQGASGQFWFGRNVGPNFLWFGPCDGPSDPTSLKAQSFGSTKAAYR